MDVHGMRVFKPKLRAGGIRSKVLHVKFHHRYRDTVHLTPQSRNLEILLYILSTLPAPRPATATYKYNNPCACILRRALLEACILFVRLT